MATVTNNGMGKSTVESKCIFCGETVSVDVPTEGYNKWQAGEYIQKALPNTSVDDREVLITGMCLDCLDGAYNDGMEDGDL